MRKINKLYYLKLEINEIKNEIKDLAEISSPSLTGMPSGGGTPSDPTYQFVMKKQKLMEKLNDKLEVYIDELTRTENIIDNIEDAETRLIARLRLVENLEWKEIAKRVNLDRSVCYRKIKKYL
jgi:hypothetical protein